MRASTSLLALATVLALPGCESVFGPGDPAPEPLTALPRALSVSEQAVIGASNRFAFGLLREARARTDDPNVFLSPLSASMALGMTMGGARDETFTEMRSALGFGDLAPAEIGASYRSLIDLLLGLDESVDVRIANSIWVREGFPIHDEFVESSRHFFDAATTTLDFADPGAPTAINDWVERSTAGKIPDIVESIDPAVMLYLINAVYFKGSWTTRFDPARTRDAPFHHADGTSRQVRMMNLGVGRVRQHSTPVADIVDLPYGRAAFSMTLVLPHPDRSLDEVVATLDAETWSAWMGQLHDAQLDVSMPRFRLEYEQVLNGTLRALGMERAFAPGGADFRGISPAGDQLFISQVKQKTFVDVNEEGTEAAAVTSVEVQVVSMPPSFRVDRPFLVAIRERLSGTILFLGTIGSPPSE